MADHPPAQDSGWLAALGMTLTALMGAGARPFWRWLTASSARRAKREEQREDKLIEFLTERIDRLEEQVRELARDRESLRAENATLKEQVRNLEARVKDQQEEIEALQKAAS